MAAFNDASTTPTALLLGGKYTNGISLTGGTYSGQQIAGIGWNVDPNGNGTLLSASATATTAATSMTTGAIVDAGGLGVAGAAYVGGAANVGGILKATAIVFPNYNTSGAGPNLIGSGSGIGNSGIGNGSTSDLDLYASSQLRLYANGTLVHTIDNAATRPSPASCKSRFLRRHLRRPPARRGSYGPTRPTSTSALRPTSKSESR